jgi:hypothetical protein
MSDNILLERKTMGLLVQVEVQEDKFILSAETGATKKVAEIPNDKVMHAFYHPCLYVAEPDELFPKSKSL